jgi:hypothetical protein
MNNQLILPTIGMLKQGNSNVTNNIKTLIYKENAALFDLLDFENDAIYQEPLLFAYFNSKETAIPLTQILYGYIITKKKPVITPVYSDENGRIYLPNYGWLHTKKPTTKFDLHTQKGAIYLKLNSEKIEYLFESLYRIGNSSFELIHYQHPLLIPHYYDVKGIVIHVEIENISKIKRKQLAKALELIKTHVPDYYKKLKKVVTKIVIFNDATLKRNSFASLSVHGCLFFNAYQADYNEVFFIEDLAHQGAHVLFNGLTASDKENYFKVDPETYLTDKGFIGWLMNRFEKRTLFVLMHALQTYYTILICLDAYLDSTPEDKHKEHEAFGRFASTLRKLEIDARIIDRKDKDGNNLYLTEKGEELLRVYKTTYSSMLEKRGGEIQSLRLRNQPYNFTYSKFIQLNPLYENVH